MPLVQRKVRVSKCAYHDMVFTMSSSTDRTLFSPTGFFILLGYGSIFFNNSLSIYYVLVVVYNWKNYQLKKVQPWLLSIPVVLAFAIAFSGIPFYEQVWLGCWLLPRPYTDDWKAVGFSTAPVVLTAIISTACQIRVYWSVRSTVRKSQKWSMEHRLKQRSQYSYNGSSSNGPSSTFAAQQQTPVDEKRKKGFSCNPCKNNLLLQDNAESAVFWQATFYLLAFYVCWPILLVAVWAAHSQDYRFWLTVSFLAPVSKI